MYIHRRIKPTFSKLFVLTYVFSLACWSSLPGTSTEIITLATGESDVIDFLDPVKRISITNPEIADATVTSPRQIVINGKGSGMTSLIVWTANDSHIKYKVRINSGEAAKQIMLKVRFLEVNKSALKELGSDFILQNMRLGNDRISMGSYGGNVNEPSNPLLLGNTVDMFFSVPTRDFTTILKALHENNLVQVLAEPNLTAASGSEAQFLAGGEFPIPIVSGSAGMQTVTIKFKEFGIRLNFKPTILDSTRIHLKTTAEVSNLDFDNGILLSGFRIPALTTRKASTEIELKQNEYLIIGGLYSSEMTETVSKIPVLGHIPFLGNLFSSKRFQNQETELIIALSPRMVSTYSEDQLPKLKLSNKEKEKQNEAVDP